MKRYIYLAGFLALVFGSQGVIADVIDFENAAEFGGDDAIVTSDYLSNYGVSFTAMAGSNAADAQQATLTFEAAGADGTDAFWTGSSGRDGALTGDLGNYLIKAGTGDLSYSRSEYFKLSIDYTEATSAASGELWDIDGPEQYQVTALDANGNAIASTTSPVGGLDAEPWAFSFDFGDAGVEIARLDIDFIGKGTLRGFAFDNFDATGANPNVATTHAAPVPMALPLGLVGLLGVAHRRRKLRQQA